MSVSAEAVANEFLALAQKDSRKLSNLQLQKLVYIAHGYVSAMVGEPLIFNDVKAWQYGPVYPKLYKKLSKYGSGEVTDKVPAEDSVADGEAKEIIKAVWDVYGGMSGSKLSALTHKEGSPWSEVWKSNQYGDIPQALIATHYKEIIDGNGTDAH